MRLALPLAVLAAAVAPATAAAVPRPAIIGGTDATLGSLPWTALVDIETGGGRFVCSGSLVAPRIVLTAAHCVTADGGGVLGAASFHVALGTGLRSTRADWRAIARVVRHPAYDPVTFHRDLALLVLGTPATGVEPARVATAADAASWADGVDAAVAGWGLVDESPATFSEVLQTATLHVAPAATCSTAWGGVYDPANGLCTPVPDVLAGPAVCGGDSGGPLAVADPDGAPRIIGITSFGAAAGCLLAPAVFQRVDVEADWIATAGTDPPPPATSAPGVEQVAQASATERTATVSATIDPHGAATSVWLETIGGNRSGPSIDVPAGAPGAVRLTLAGLLPASQTRVAVVAQNAEGRMRSTQVTLATVDRTAPAVAPRLARVRPGRTARLRFRVADASRGVVAIRVEIQRAGRPFAVWDAASVDLATGSEAAVAWHAPRRLRGAWRFCVRATDASGNAARRCAAIRVA